MPGEVVGTAFVRIKALTDNLAKDIKSEVERGMKGAGLDKVGADSGKELGENLGKSSMGEAKKSIKKESKGIFQDVADEAKLTSKEIAQQLNAGTLRQDFFDDTGIFDKFLNNVKLKLNAADISFQEFRDNVRARFESAGDSVGAFFNRTSAGFRSLVNVDKDSGFDDTLNRIGKKLKDFGDGGFGDLLSKLPLKIGAIGGAILGALPYIQDIGAAVLAYATGLVAQIGFLVTALGGLGVAAAAAIGSTATLALPLVLAFKAETEALLNFKDSLAAAGDEFLTIGVATQQTLLPALDNALVALQDLIEPLSEFGLLVGRAVGNFAVFFANVLTGEEAMGRFQAILQSALRIFDLLQPTIINVGNILSGIWVAAIPASERFVASLGNVIQGLSETVTEGLRTGSLVDTFNKFYDRAQLLGGALADISVALLNILGIGADSSDSVFERFGEFADRYRAFTESESGRGRIALIFDNALAVMREINGVAADLFDGIFGRLGEIGGVDSLVGALQRFREVLPGIQEGFQDMLGPIKEVVEFLLKNLQGKLTKVIDELSEPLGRLAFQILDLLKAMEQSGAFDTLLDLLKIMTDVLSTLLSIPGFGTFIGYMIAFSSATKIAKIALGPFISVLGSFVIQIGQLIGVAKGKALTDAATALTRFASGFANAGSAAGTAAGATANAASQIVRPLSTIGTAAAGTAGSLGTAAGSLGALAVPLGLVGAALGLGAVAFFNHQQSVQAWRQEIRQAEDALGTLNGGLLVTAEGIEKYIRESSGFADNGQLKTLAELGISIEGIAVGISEGTLSLQEFAESTIDAAINADDLVASLNNFNTTERTDIQVDSVEALAAQYRLTAQEVENLRQGQEVYAEVAGETIGISLDGIDELVNSYENLNKVIADGIEENIGAFTTNQTNLELLGSEFLNTLQGTIDDNSTSDSDRIALMEDAYVRLGEAATTASAGIIGISNETRRQIKEQAATAGSEAEVAIAQYELLQAEQDRVFREIRGNFELFNGDEFEAQFGTVRQTVLDFSDEIANVDFTLFSDSAAFAGIDGILANFGDLGIATQNLFAQLATLPEAEFNAAAQALGADADDLRTAMEGANQAIQDLADTAVSSLPTIGSLLQDATEVREDGSQFFDSDAFLRSAQDRITETQNFSQNITDIAARGGQALARQAAQEGPEAAAALAELVAANGPQLDAVIQQMEQAEADLRTQISTVLGPGIATEYGIAAGLIGPEVAIGIGTGLNDPVAVAALVNAGSGVAETIAEQLNFYFVPDGENGMRAIRRIVASNNGGGGFRKFSDGGFVDDKSTFGKAGPFGTDTVNAWLTPGEFVLRKAVAQSIPRNILTSLNAGDPRIVGLLTGITNTRSDTLSSVSNFTTTAGPSGPGVVIQNMNIQAPSPLESSRQIADRLRILQSQLSSR